jgi:hypothetical protein
VSFFPTFTYGNTDFRTHSSEMNQLGIPLSEDAPPANRAVRLPPFWTTNPRSWFTSAEGAFRLRNIADEESKFYICLHALPETMVSLIAYKQGRLEEFPAGNP